MIRRIQSLKIAKIQLMRMKTMRCKLSPIRKLNPRTMMMKKESLLRKLRINL